MVNRLKIAAIVIIASVFVACSIIVNQASGDSAPVVDETGVEVFPGDIKSVEPASAVEGVIEVGGRRLEIVRGNAYEVDDRTGRRVLREKVYDYGFYDRSYRNIDGEIYRLVNDGNGRYPTFSEFSADFEAANDITELVNADRGWTYFMLMSPMAPTTKSFVSLRQRIMAGRSDFLDNRIEPSDEYAHTGKTSLKAVAVPATKNVPVSKASLGTELLHFAAGDDVWFSGWFFIKEGLPATIVDLESSYFYQGAGMRLLLNRKSQPRLELKWPTRPSYTMSPGVDYRFPPNRWVHVEIHYLLSERNDGIAQLWIDGRLLVDSRGQTLPLSNTIYDRLEVGITANPVGESTVLYADDIRISRTPLN